MPTILFINGFQFIIWPDDHETPHVHAFNGDGEAKIRIGKSEVGMLPLLSRSMD